jgi:four helix bundle protein
LNGYPAIHWYSKTVVLEMKYDLEDRLIKYAVSILDVVELLPDAKAAAHLANQIIRSGTAPALMYGEALAAESRKDFIHKMLVGLKELRETLNYLRIIYLKKYISNMPMIESLIQENNELIAIFVRSVKTARDNSQKVG